MKVLFDNNVPLPLRRHLKEYEVFPARQMGWQELTNGSLLSAAEAAGFQVMVTGDKNLSYQQNLTGRKISLIVLSAISWNLLQLKITPIRAAIERAVPGSFETVELGHPIKRRRMTYER